MADMPKVNTKHGQAIDDSIRPAHPNSTSVPHTLVSTSYIGIACRAAYRKVFAGYFNLPVAFSIIFE